MSMSRALWVSTLLTCGACQYDFNELYTTFDGGTQRGDGGVGDAGLRSSHLIGLWGDYASVDDECIRCAETACAAVDVACKGDPECAAFTRCVAETPTPAGKMACRARHIAWVTSKDFLAHDYNGPYGQCVFRDSCSRECDGASDMMCLRDYTWPLTSEAMVPLHLILNDSDDLTRAVPGITAKVCPEGDPLCKAPVATGVTDANGYIKLELPTSFNRAFSGYIEVQGGEFFPQLLKFNWLIGEPTVQVMTLINRATFEMFGSFLTFPLDATRGIVQTRVFGCSGMGLRGAKLDITGVDEKTTNCYMSNGLPSFTATETDSLGAGIAFNILPGTGYQTIKATRASDGVIVSRANVPIRAGFITVVILEPESL